MTNHKNAKRSKKIMKAATASGLALIIAGSGASMALAADGTTDTTPNLTAAENASLTAEYNAAVNGRMTGSIKNISIPDANQAAELKALGFNIDLPGSIAASNALNATNNNDYPLAALKLTLDEAAFKANSPLASKIDLAGTPGSDYNKGLDLALGDGTHYAFNFQKKEDAVVPNLPVGAINRPWMFLTGQPSGQLGANTYELTHIFPSSSVTDGGVANDLNGNTDSAHSVFTLSSIVDRFADSAQRQADLTLGGAQRGVFSSGLSTCVSAVQSSCGVWVTPVGSGLVTVDSNGTQKEETMAVAAPVWIQIDSDVAAQAPVHTEANPFVAASGDKVYFAPINKGGNALDDSGDHNILNPSVAIKPWQFAGEFTQIVDGSNPSLDILKASYDGANFTIPVTASSPLVDDAFTVSQTQGTGVNNQILTLTSTNDRLGSSWVYDSGVLVAGQKISVEGADETGSASVIATATVVEASKGKLVLSFDLNKPNTTFPFTAAALGTGAVAMGQGASVTVAPAYEMKVIKGTPVVPVPSETPVTPVVPTPSETPTPTTPVPSETPTPEVTTSTVAIPDEAATDGFQMDDLAETGAKGVSLAVTLAQWAFGLGVAMLAGAGILKVRARRLAKASK